MRPQPLAEIASVVGGTLRGDDTVITGLSSDSREVREGDLFAAIAVADAIEALKLPLALRLRILASLWSA